MAGIGASGISGGISSVGAAVSDLYGAKGAKRAAQGYDASAVSLGRAADIADQNAEITRRSTELTKMQQEREIYKTIGGQQADIAGAGFSASGTALDLLRDSTAQGDLTLRLIEEQGLINENAYRLQAESYRGQQQLALSQADTYRISAAGKKISAIINGVSAALSFASVGGGGGGGVSSVPSIGVKGGA